MSARYVLFRVDDEEAEEAVASLSSGAELARATVVARGSAYDVEQWAFDAVRRGE